MSAVNYERRQFLPSKVIWDGTIERSEVFRYNVEGKYGSGYLFDTRFQEENVETGVDCHIDLLIFRIKYLLLPRSRRMQEDYMEHYLVHARVV
jgi:hypothetical protein